jgi:hypothetical protein
VGRGKKRVGRGRRRRRRRRGRKKRLVMMEEVGDGGGEERRRRRRRRIARGKRENRSIEGDSGTEGGKARAGPMRPSPA